MTWMNEHEVERIQHMFDPDEAPKLVEATRALARLVNWTNQNSDGWPYWQLPSKAAGKLQERLKLAEDALRRNGAVDDLTKDEWSRLFRPIRQFLSDRKVDDPDLLLFPPPPPPPPGRGIELTRGQLEAWAGRTLTDEEVESLDEVIQFSSIPDAIATMADSLNADAD